MTLDLHEDGLILCENGGSLSHGSLSASHPIREGCMGSHKLCYYSREHENCIQKIMGGNRDMLRR